MSYILLNPNLSDNTIRSNASSLNTAAEDIWSQLSSNIKNYTPNFLFTIQNQDNNKLYHFNVKEGMENNRVKYSLKQFKGKVDGKLLTDSVKQEGGRRKKHHKSSSSSDSSDSSSSSSPDVFTFPNKHHKHENLVLTYYPSIYGVPNVLLPTFTTAFAPFGVSIKLPMVSSPVVMTIP